MADRPRYARSSCCVPFCGRTSTLFRDEWLCGAHWRLIPRRLRRAWFRASKQVHRAWEAAPAPGGSASTNVTSACGGA